MGIFQKYSIISMTRWDKIETFPRDVYKIFTVVTVAILRWKRLFQKLLEIMWIWIVYSQNKSKHLMMFAY